MEQQQKDIFKQRLLDLADFLDTVPDENFDYTSWVSCDWDGKSDLISCGTKACALGWATTMPQFQKLGLRLIKNLGEDGVVVLEEDIYSAQNSYKTHGYAFKASNRIFGLTEYQSNCLFVPRDGDEDFMSPKEVANKIRINANNIYG